MTIFGTVTGKTEIKNGWEFELNIKLNFFIISTLESQSDENCTHFLLFVRSPARRFDGVVENVSLIELSENKNFQWKFHPSFSFFNVSFRNLTLSESGDCNPLFKAKKSEAKNTKHAHREQFHGHLSTGS